jgi:bifunctional DNase/RNase
MVVFGDRFLLFGCIPIVPMLEYMRPMRLWMSDMVEVVIDSIRVSLMNQQRIVILREVDMERYLAIWVGVYEAEHLTIALQDVEVARPLTYDLFKNVIGSLDAQILRVEVVALRDETYYGNIVMDIDGKVINIDSRPSDALNLAVRAHVPILVAREVMESAGIIPEEDEMDEVAEEVEAQGDDGEDRLSVFEDFLEQLDLDDMEDEEE